MNLNMSLGSLAEGPHGLFQKSHDFNHHQRQKTKIVKEMKNIK